MFVTATPDCSSTRAMWYSLGPGNDSNCQPKSEPQNSRDRAVSSAGISRCTICPGIGPPLRLSVVRWTYLDAGSHRSIGFPQPPMPPPLAQVPDEALLALVARGDDSALAELYDRFGGVAYGLAYRILRDAVLAQDAVQEAFLAAWRTAVSFDRSRGSASTWLLTLVHRRAVDLVRREDRRRGVSIGDPPVAARRTPPE